MENRSPWLSRLALLTAVAVAIVITRLLYVFWPYPETLGAAGFRDQVLQERLYLRANMEAEAWGRVERTHRAVHEAVMVRLGLGSYLKRPGGTFGPGFLQRYASDIGSVLHHSVMQFGMRLGALVEMLPWFAACGGVALLDGLRCRSRRRHLALAESAFLYGRGRDLAILAWVVAGLYVLLPWPLPPGWALVPSMLLFSVALRIVGCYCKKYI